jgi:hypothetical protein
VYEKQLHWSAVCVVRGGEGSNIRERKQKGVTVQMSLIESEQFPGSIITIISIIICRLESRYVINFSTLRIFSAPSTNDCS